MKKLTPRLHAAPLLTIALLLSSAHGANPNSSNFEMGFGVHGEASEVLHDLCQTNLEKIATALDGFHQQAEAGRAGRVNASQIGAVNVQLVVAQRAATQLELLGETAGMDYRSRLNFQGSRLTRFLGTYHADPNSRRAVEQAVATAGKQMATRTKQIKKIRQLIEDKKWEQAEATLFQVSDQFEKIAPVAGLAYSRVIKGEYRQVQEQIDLAMKPRRAAEARQILTDRIRDETVDMSALAGTINQWSQTLRQSDTVNVGGNSLTGAELVSLAASEWEVSQAKTIHRAALTWLLNQNQGASGNSTGLALPTTERKGDSWTDQYASATADIHKALIGLILADAARATDAEAGQIYLAHLNAWAPLLNRGGSDNAAVEAALRKLAEKSPTVAREVDAYAAATDQLLRWRGRVAEARGKAAAASYSEASTQFRDLATTTQETPGFFQPRSDQRAALTPKMPEVLERVAEKAVGSQVYSTGFWSLGDQRPLISRLNPDCYASATPLDSAQAQQFLANDLQVDEKNPALTLQATRAVESAASGRYVRLGGEPTAITLESLTTRLVTVPTTTPVLFPLGDLSAIEQSGLISDVILRYDLRSNWAQNRYFFLSN